MFCELPGVQQTGCREGKHEPTKAMLEKIAQFKAGDKVKVTWVFNEHCRIETIE